MRQPLEEWALAVEEALSSVIHLGVGVSLGGVLLNDVLETLVGLHHLDDQVSLVDLDVLEDMLVEHFVFAGYLAVEVGVFDVDLQDLWANAVEVVYDVLDWDGDSVLEDELFDHSLDFRAGPLLESDWSFVE